MKKSNRKRFDPFGSRLARDIRNSLSESFLQALGANDPVSYRRNAGDYLSRNLEDPYREYIKERLKKYDEVFDILIHNGSDNIMEQAQVFWDHELYFEMHELLEKLWIGAQGDRRRGLQGLIRAAGMKIHAENKNMKAAISMGRKARVDLELYGSSLADFPGMEKISAEVSRALADMEGDSRRNKLLNP